MKRDMDMIRELLLKIEAAETADSALTLSAKDSERRAEVVYNLVLMYEAGLIHAALATVGTFGPRPQDVRPYCLTWQGHEYLDTIRDEAVWRKTKAAAKQAGGYSLNVLATVATAIVAEAAKRAVGLP